MAAARPSRGASSVLDWLQRESSPGGSLWDSNGYMNPALALGLAQLLARDPVQARAALASVGYVPTTPEVGLNLVWEVECSQCGVIGRSNDGDNASANLDAHESLHRGIEQAAKGELHDLGDFTQYADEALPPIRPDQIDEWLAIRSQMDATFPEVLPRASTDPGDDE